jgi:hypothetical protein
MLNTYLYYKIATNPKNRLDKELINVFDKENKNSLEIINEIDKFSNSYINILNENDKYIFCLRYLRHKIYWHSILTTSSFVEYKDIDTLKELLVAYYYQNWIAGATIARIKQTSFNILKLVKNNKSIDAIKKEMQSNLSKYDTTKTYKEELAGSYVYGRNWDKPLLLLVEYFSNDDSDNPTYRPINNKLHLEHILPQEPEKYGWDKIFTKEERDTWTDSLANLTLLAMRKNIQAQNFSFDKKKEVYRNKDNVITSFNITKDILDNDKWEVKELEGREDKLINQINKKLDLF